MPHTLTISQLTDKLAQGELTSRDATQACLDRIAAVDGQLNAFLSHDPEDALAQADAADAANLFRNVYLATLTSEAEQNATAQMIGAVGINAWIGGNDAANHHLHRLALLFAHAA